MTPPAARTYIRNHRGPDGNSGSRLHTDATESFGQQGLPLNRSQWPQTTLDIENRMVEMLSSSLSVDELHDQEDDSGSSSGNDGPSGQVNEPGGITGTAATINRRREWEGDLTTRLNAVGITDWRSVCNWAEGVRVGIIDWGFADLDDNPDPPKLGIYDEENNPEGNAYRSGPVRNGAGQRGPGRDTGTDQAGPAAARPGHPSHRDGDSRGPAAAGTGGEHRAAAGGPHHLRNPRPPQRRRMPADQRRPCRRRPPPEKPWSRP